MCALVFAVRYRAGVLSVWWCNLLCGLSMCVCVEGLCVSYSGEWSFCYGVL